MHLAKQALDIGLYTNDRAAMLEFWRGRIGVPFDGVLPASGGVQQHRHLIGGSILKVNHAREPLKTAPPCGLQALSVSLPGAEASAWLRDPDGNWIEISQRKSITGSLE